MISNLKAQPKTAFNKLIINEESFIKTGRSKELDNLKTIAKNNQYKAIFDGFHHLSFDQEITAYGNDLTSITVIDKLRDITYTKAIKERQFNSENILMELFNIVKQEMDKRNIELDHMIKKLKEKNWPVDS